MSRTILVLSSTGSTGSATVTALLAKGANVRAASRDPQKVPAGVTGVFFNFDAPETWAQALDGVDALYLCLPPFRSDEVELGTALIEAAKKAGVTKIVKLSAIGVEYNPESGHRRLERVIEESGLQWIHLRPSFFFENFINFYGATIKADGNIYLPAGKGRTAFVATEDIGAAAAEALLGSATGHAWVLTGSELLTHDQIAEKLSRAIGKSIHFVDISPEAHIEGMRAWGMPELAVQSMSGLYTMVRADAAAIISPDIEKIIGRKPVLFSDWAHDHVVAWG